MEFAAARRRGPAIGEDVVQPVAIPFQLGTTRKSREAKRASKLHFQNYLLFSGYLKRLVWIKHWTSRNVFQTFLTLFSRTFHQYIRGDDDCSAKIAFRDLRTLSVVNLIQIQSRMFNTCWWRADEAFEVAPWRTLLREDYSELSSYFERNCHNCNR